MPGYFGTPTQQRLQAQAETSAAFLRDTPGAVQAGRFIACDDPDLFGWDNIATCVERDGICGFRLLTTSLAAKVEAKAQEMGYKFDTWQVFMADRAAALPASKAILARGLPDGLTEMPAPKGAESDDIRRVQALMAGAGIVPFSGSMLTGDLGVSATIVIGTGEGEPVATAHAYFPHNAHSPHHRHAWGGLVAVSEAFRGKGIGAYVNARMVQIAFDDLGATHVYELISPGNVASQRMVEACGLRFDPGLICGIATPLDSARFTR